MVVKKIRGGEWQLYAFNEALYDDFPALER
jgi:hypothetical protein